MAKQLSELSVLNRIIKALDGLTDAERARVLAYLIRHDGWTASLSDETLEQANHAAMRARSAWVRKSGVVSIRTLRPS